MNLPPAEIGMPVEEIDTPALLVEMEPFERNLARLAAAAARAGVRTRPHAKTHKSAMIACRQVAAGAIGICCQKVGEAEAMVRGGVRDVLVTNQIVGERKLRRLAALAREARVAVCVDHPENVSALGRAADAAGAELGVLVEIDVGARRCGVPPGKSAVELAGSVARTPGLRFEGLQAYQGRAQHLRTHEERAGAIAEAVRLAADTVEALAAAGLACPVVSGAGTGTFELEAASGVYTEIQAGSYVFMDADYARNRSAGGGAFDTFEHSLFVYASVMSVPSPELAVVDAGLKAYSLESGLPEVRGRSDVEVSGASDEHGKLDLSGSNARYRLGEKVFLIPGHCDPTVNLHDWYVCVRGGRVEALWPVDARGALH
jgi:D-serine deaminase-like pyridoxal phosphate-dependent protein